MKPNHLTDIEIQQFVLQAADCNLAAMEHTRHCESCRARARGYTLLFNAVEQQARPAFDFDLPEMVMCQLVRPQATPVSQSLMVFCIWLLSAAFLGTTVFLLGEQLTNLFISRSSTVLYTALTSAAAFTIFLVMESYREFRGKMKQLNFN